MVGLGRDVLVVDDSHDLLTFMDLLLSAEGYAVRTAATIEQAEHALIEQLPDLIIVDVRMPPLPPFAVLERIDAESKTAGLPVLLCTAAAHDLRAQPERLLRPKTEALLKPFEIEDLLASVERLLAPGAHHAQLGALTQEHG